MSQAHNQRSRADATFEPTRQEHLLQAGLVEALHHALLDKNTATAREVLDRLSDVTALHFLSEELLMRLHSYPGYDAHCAQHAHLLEHMADLKARFATGDSDATVQALLALNQHLINHIHEADDALHQHLERVPFPTA